MLMPDLSAMQLHEASQLLSQGWKQKALAGRYGVSEPTMSRLLSKLRDSSNADEAVTKNYATGPRDEHALTTDEISVLKLGMIEKRSRRLAAQELLDSEFCQAETFERLSAIFDRAAETRGDEVWPKWFQRACIVTDEERLMFRGSKAFQTVAGARARGRFVIYEGRQIPLFPNAIWEFDDESENRMRVELDENGKARLNRQTLKAIDVDTSFYLGTKNIDRDSDGYRLEDQADFFLELVDAHGLPNYVRIERGPWDNNFWFGIPFKREWWQTPDCPQYRFGGIDIKSGGPCEILQCVTSRQKGLIEGSFNHLQNIDAHKTLDIGRFRGEHETAARHVRRARTGQADAISHFPNSAASADISAESMIEFNSEAKRRKFMHGTKKVVPAELYAQAVKRVLPSSERWRFLPVKVGTTAKNMHITVKVPRFEIPFQFSTEGFVPTWDWNAWLPHGWRVFACFHPLRTDLGCHIFNALHPDHPQNPRRFPLGMPLGVLPFAPLAPHASDVPGDFSGRKQTMAAIRSEVRIIRASKKSVRVSTVVAAGRVRSARIGSADPLASLDSGAPPVTDLPDTSLERGGDFRSATDPRAGIGEADRGRPGQTAAYAHEHGPARRAQGPIQHPASSIQSAADRLAELEAALE